MTLCSTPRCSRRPGLTVRAPNLWEEGVDEREMCVPCYMAMSEGFRRHPGNVQWKITDERNIGAADLRRLKRSA